jgi:hypothetical protein
MVVVTQWFNEQCKDTCIRAVGLIDKQTVNLDDAWYVEYRYDYRIEATLSLSFNK